MKRYILAWVTAILFVLAIASMLASIALTIDNSPWAIFCALVALPAVICGRALLWMLDRRDWL